MNSQIEKFAREQLKEGLALCTDKEQEIFKCMYIPKKSMDKPPDEDTLRTTTINDVVDQMESSKLDWAMTQVDKTLDKKKYRNDGGPEDCCSCHINAPCSFCTN